MLFRWDTSYLSSALSYSCDISDAYFINSEMASSLLTVEASLPCVRRAGQILTGVFCSGEKAVADGSEAAGQSAKGNLQNALLRSSMPSNHEKITTYSRRTCLTDDEIMGNTFMFMLAGKSDP
jgi:hypothetical protein